MTAAFLDRPIRQKQSHNFYRQSTPGIWDLVWCFVCGRFKTHCHIPGPKRSTPQIVARCSSWFSVKCNSKFWNLHANCCRPIHEIWVPVTADVMKLGAIQTMAMIRLAGNISEHVWTTDYMSWYDWTKRKAIRGALHPWTRVQVVKTAVSQVICSCSLWWDNHSWAWFQF